MQDDSNRKTIYIDMQKITEECTTATSIINLSPAQHRAILILTSLAAWLPLQLHWDLFRGGLPSKEPAYSEQSQWLDLLPGPLAVQRSVNENLSSAKQAKASERKDYILCFVLLCPAFQSLLLDSFTTYSLHFTTFVTSMYGKELDFFQKWLIARTLTNDTNALESNSIM